MLLDRSTEQDVRKSIESIKRERKAAKPPIEDYLVIGEYLHRRGKEISSTKLLNAQIKREHPEILILDQALRSNCKRLWEALNGVRDTDLLQVLGVSDIRDYYTTHPTVIIRDRRNIKNSQAD